MKDNGLYRNYFFHFDILFMIILFLVMTGLLVLKVQSFVVFIFFAIGLFTYMFGEYVTHRFLFHLKAPKNEFFLNLLKRLHYDHHKYPNNLKLLFLPLWYSIPNFLILLTLFYLIVKKIDCTLAFGMGLVFMLLVYEWKHYIAHQPIKPKTKFGVWLKKTHILHHYKNENYWFGVSNPFFDIIFGTLKDEKTVETSSTAKDLEKRVQ
ncbi:sterol desaturase family protein [Neobacillus massiliamazoniensis]|uniref:Fatty acid hydroxylase-like protein n=1 Tax=Neobacillus massiliamazoniensis TaxID=1499688 RepID=A0A0U1P4G2_9BACI|nr:sterol desaturase family protein [Neobacillus massiliamazoniensis]CRK84972.1 fatty acid hydroxylase-like protein [Neobacillus massiliamazoniensis]